MYSVQSNFGCKRLNIFFLAFAALTVANNSIASDKTNTLFTQFNNLNTNASKHLYLGSTLLVHEGLIVKCCPQCKDNNGKDCFYVNKEDGTTIILNDTQVVALCEQARPSSPAPANIQAPTQSIETLTNVEPATAPQVSKLADYNLVITAGAVTAGLATKYIAKNNCGATEKKAFFAGIITTSATSLAGQSLQQGEHTPGTVFTQLAIDNAVYTAIQHASNFFYPPAKKQRPAPATAKVSPLSKPCK